MLEADCRCTDGNGCDFTQVEKACCKTKLRSSDSKGCSLSEVREDGRSTNWQRSWSFVGCISDEIKYWARCKHTKYRIVHLVLRRVWGGGLSIQFSYMGEPSPLVLHIRMNNNTISVTFMKVPPMLLQ